MLVNFISDINTWTLMERRKVVISSVYGLGEGLVSGLLDADTFNISYKVCEYPVFNRQQVANRFKAITTLSKAP